MRDSGVLWAPGRASWWSAVFFVIGSTCFLVGPLPAFLDLVGGHVDALVFFVGSVFFTAAATVQWVDTIDAGRAGASGGSLRLLSWEPHRIDWWSSGVQLVGTLFFNATTFRALSTSVDTPSYDRVVWRPDAFGSVCFLISGYLAYVAVAGGLVRWPPGTLEGVTASVNLAGCVAFGLSALGAFVLPTTGSQVNVTIANAATSVGALGFLVGAVLLLPEGARAAAADEGGPLHLDQ
ncbi:MAG: hypothetical protein ACXVW6_11240 [Nocardioidaceae bacterium]